ncbi:MAG: hypothetical protein IJP91_05795 [Synergistaceae bacterium]|nr:hypothetical protein [Synergistaceae bacterium]
MAELTWIEEHYINEGIAQGRAEGKRFAVAEIAKRLRNIGMNDSQIHQLTDLSLDEIVAI